MAGEVALIDPVIFKVVGIEVVAVVFSRSERGVVYQVSRDFKVWVLLEIAFGRREPEIACVAFGRGREVIDDVR